MFNVAVIMSIYKSDKLDHLRQAVESIVNQDFRNLIFYVYIDGPVPDDIKFYVDSFRHCYPMIQTIWGPKNKGLAHALNEMIERALAVENIKYLARMDSDDISRSDRISRQVEFLEKTPQVDVCGSYCEEFGTTFSLEEKRVPINHDELRDYSVARCPFIHPTVMFRRSVFEGGVRYPVNTSLTEDMALWFILLRAGFIFANIPECLLRYRLHTNTLARRKGIKKAFSEFSTRMRSMLDLKMVTGKNISLVAFRLVFHLLPNFILGYLYRKHRQ